MFKNIKTVLLKRFLDLFKIKSKDEKIEKYLSILEKKYNDYKKFETKVRYGTKMYGAFYEYLCYLNYFKKYLTKIFELTKNDTLSTEIHELAAPHLRPLGRSAKYFNEFSQSIKVFEDMNTIPYYYQYDLISIYEFYNEYAPLFNKERKRFPF